MESTIVSSMMSMAQTSMQKVYYHIFALSVHQRVLEVVTQKRKTISHNLKMIVTDEVFSIQSYNYFDIIFHIPIRIPKW